MASPVQRLRVLAVASGGGHWIQLQRLKPAFVGHDVLYVTTLRGLGETIPDERVQIVRDASRARRVAALLLLAQLFTIVVRFRPQVVITTGAAPGVLALWLSKLIGARTVWIDSIANVEDLSMSGRMAEKYADLWLTQWEHLVPRHAGLSFRGSVI